MPRTENLTIMFTDIVGFTTLTSTWSREQNKSMLRRHDRILLPVVSRYGGRKIKSIGDALLLVFRSPTDAVRCGMALHDALAEDNLSRPEAEKLTIRVAVNVGEVLLEKGDVFGEAVNVAARIESLTPPHEIYLSEAVYLAMNKAEVAAEKVSTEHLKGIPEPVTLYRVPTHSVSRLVASDETIDDSHGELPFGGMNHMDVKLRFSDYLSWRIDSMLEKKGTSLRQFGTNISNFQLSDLAKLKRKTKIGLAALIAGIGISVMAAQFWGAGVTDWLRSNLTATSELFSSRESELLKAADPLLNKSRYNEAHTIAKEALEKNPNNAEAILLLGHIDFARNRRRSGAEQYKLAAELEPSLLSEPRAIQNLVAALGWVSKEVMPLIRMVDSPLMIDKLAARSGAEGYYGRQAAIALLVELGHSNRVDRIGAAIQDLTGRQECEDRLVAVKKLRRYQDRRAVPALKDIVNANFMARLKNGCLMNEARNTLKELGGK